MSRVAVATTSQLAADAAAEVAEAGGNAVDCGVAAALLTINTEPGVCALAGSAFVTLWLPGGDPITIDGNVAVPGAGLINVDPAAGIVPVHMEYGGGVETLVGAASVAVPGTLAALEVAVSHYGELDWPRVVEPSIRAARNGFPLSSACQHYLQYSGDEIFGRSDDGHAALHNSQGELHAAGSNIRVPGLADSLEQISREGSACFYRGDLAQRIVQHVQDRGGLLTREDLESYRALERPALQSVMGDWRIATNPSPAVGGAVLLSMLLAFEDGHFARWDESAVQHLINVQHAALSFRTRILDLSDDVQRDVDLLLSEVSDGNLLSRYASGSTVHTSAVDEQGAACAITASSGYGSGEMPAGTGLWLNNCVGELELNRHGIDAGPPGARLPSNMAPTIARNERTVLAAGSPGADRITTALQQFFINYAMFGMSLDDAIDYPRLHLEVRGPEPVIAVEPGLQLPETHFRMNRYAKKGMYFGGVGIALHDELDGLQVAADPRREGGTYKGIA